MSWTLSDLRSVEISKPVFLCKRILDPTTHLLLLGGASCLEGPSKAKGKPVKRKSLSILERKRKY